MRHAATRALLSRRDVDRGLGVVHLRHRRCRGLPRPASISTPGTSCAATRSCAGSSIFSTSATTSTSTAAPSACAATSSRSSPPTRERRRCASSSSATRSRPSPRSIRCAARSWARSTSLDLPRLALRDAGADRLAQAMTGIKVELRERLGRAAGADEAGREAAARAAHHVRPRDARADGPLQRHRELLAPSVGPRAGRAAADADRLLPQRLSAVRRRVAPDRAAGRVDVQRRSLAQRDAGRIRLSPAVRARQPAAQVRRVGGPRRGRRSTSRRRRATTS